MPFFRIDLPPGGPSSGSPFGPRTGGSFAVTLGVCLILFGVLVIAIPELLIWLVGSFFLLAGFSLVSFGLTVRRRSRDVRKVFEDFQ